MATTRKSTTTAIATATTMGAAQLSVKLRVTLQKCVTKSYRKQVLSSCL